MWQTKKGWYAIKPNQTFKNEILYKLFTYKSYVYIYLNVCKQMTDVI